MGEMLDEEEFEGLNFKYSEECESLVGERYTFKAYTMKNGIDFISFFIKVGSEREVKVDFKEIIEIQYERLFGDSFDLEEIGATIKKAEQQGYQIILVTVDMDEVPEANKVSVLKDVETFYTKLIRKDDCILSIMYSDEDS